MLVVKLITYSKGKFLVPKHCFDVLPPLNCNVFLQQQRKNQLKTQNGFEGDCIRQLHTTRTVRDMSESVKAIGGGMAAMGMIGPGIGIGVIYGNALLAGARNPSLMNKFFQLALMGTVFCESLALFALLVSFVIIF